MVTKRPVMVSPRPSLKIGFSDSIGRTETTSTPRSAMSVAVSPPKASEKSLPIAIWFRGAGEMRRVSRVCLSKSENSR